jgi:hypothetical protein
MTVTLLNSANCVLDQRVVETEEEARTAAIEMIAGLACLNEGDKLVVGAAQ